MSWLSFGVPPSSPHLFEPWLDLRCTVWAQFATGSSQRQTGERERDREEKRREEKQTQRFPSSLPSSHPPSPSLFSPTLSTQRILAAAGGSTAPLQWHGGGGEVHATVYKHVVLPRLCCCQMGFKQRVSVICDSTVCRFSIQPNTTSEPPMLFEVCYSGQRLCLRQINSCMFCSINMLSTHHHRS